MRIGDVLLPTRARIGKLCGCDFDAFATCLVTAFAGYSIKLGLHVMKYD